MKRRLAALPPALRRAALAAERSEAEIERELAAAPAAAPLRGLPYLAKDLFDVAGLPTHAGSSFLAKVRPVTADSTLIARLRKLGAALAGKTHLVEFAAGLTGENRTYGDCPHPHIPNRLAGGSSSGSAALVAAGVAPFSLGTDTGGSVRVPAACCGLYGYRGAPGDAFIRDVFPLSPTCDTAGWFTAHPGDLLELTSCLVPEFNSGTGTPRGAYLHADDLLAGSPVGAACSQAAADFAGPAGSEARAALLESWRGSTEAYATIVMHEANRIHRAWLEPHRADYDPGIWQRFTDAAHIPEGKVAQARAVAARIKEGFAAYFREHDFLALPCSPFPALLKAECTPPTRLGILTFTTPASLAGLPCVTLPVHLGGGLTAGLQVIAAPERPGVLRWILERAAARF